MPRLIFGSKGWLWMATGWHVMSAFQPKTREELRDAVLEACSSGGEMNSWDTSLVTDMSGLFEGQRDCNIPIGSWDVSNVTNMRGMFEGAHSFNQIQPGHW
eukprot:Skav212667  [mRNA]  locus=scaffold1227:599932:600234:+ [translate_table: standard]